MSNLVNWIKNTLPTKPIASLAVVGPKIGRTKITSLISSPTPRVCPKSSFPDLQIPSCAAGSKIPKMPTVVLIPKRAAVFPALKSPCKTLFDKVNKERKVIHYISCTFSYWSWKALYPFATGLNNILSKP